LKNPATEAKQDDIIANQTDGSQKTQIVESDGETVVDQFGVDDAYPAGTGSVGTLTLTSASTAYTVPATAPTGKHILVIYNGSDTDVFWGYSTLTSGGIIIPAGRTLALKLGANQSIYLYCASAGKVVNYSVKLV
jgi:hypothetical protein